MTANLTNRRIAALTAVAALVLAVVWYAALFRPQNAHLASTHRATAAAQQQETQLLAQVTALEALERQIPADKARLAALDQAVPAQADLQDVLDQLHALATATSCQLTTVSPQSGTQSSSPGTPVNSITISMTATGNYSQLMGFLSGLAHMPRTVVVDNVAISPGTAGQMTLTLSSRIFHS